MQEVTDVLKWENLESSHAPEEELRYWLGGGQSWPGLVLRLKGSPPDHTVGEFVFWWVRSDLGNSIRRSFEKDQRNQCRRIVRGRHVEACLVTLPGADSIHWTTLWAEQHLALIKTAAFQDTAPTLPAPSDSVVAALEWRANGRVVRFVPIIRIPPDPLALAMFCFFQAAQSTIGLPAEGQLQGC